MKSVNVDSSIVCYSLVMNEVIKTRKRNMTSCESAIGIILFTPFRLIEMWYTTLTKKKRQRDVV
jgi:hypothetical protein